MKRIAHISGVLALLLATAACAAHSQIVISTPREGEVSPYRSQAVIGTAPAGWTIRLQVNGLQVDSGTVRPDGVFEFLGVPAPDGPVTLMVTAQLKNGKPRTAVRTMHILGAPDTIRIHPAAYELPADGQTILPVIVDVVDRWGVIIPSGYFITVQAEGLTILGADVDPTTPGYQVRLDSGRANISLVAQSYVGPALLSLTTNGVTAQTEIHAVTPVVPFMLIGSADASGRYLKTRGDTQGFQPEDDFKDGLQSRGRFAAMGRGTVFDDYLLTLSIDTDRNLQDRIFRDLDPNVLYSMYGDNSIVRYEAQSTSPIFAKVEQNQSYLLYGDFNTEMTQYEYSAYNRSFTGGKLHLQDKPYTVEAFATLTNREVVQEEIRGQGISGFYYLKQNNVVTGSEKVRIEVRDRFHQEVVLSQNLKSRYSDYEIDYIQGSLYFKQPVPSLDDQNNPVYIVVAYEAISNTPDNVVAGGGAELRLGEMFALGGTLVVENRSPQNYMLYGGAARLHLDSIGTLLGEVARSTQVDSKGNAWKVEMELAPIHLFTLRPYYRKVDDTFVNPTQSGSGRELGTTKYGGTLELRPFAGTQASFEFYKQAYTVGMVPTDIRSFSGSVRQELWNGGNLDLKVDDVVYAGENPETPDQNLNTHSTLLTGKIGSTIVEGFRAWAELEKNLRKAETQVRPDAVSLGLEYDVSKSISLYAQHKIMQDDGQLTTVGINTRVTDQTSVYGRYEIGNSISGERNAATIGLKNQFQITKELTANLMFEKTKNLSKNLTEARTPDHDALSASLEYFPHIPLRATLKGEYANESGASHKGVDYGIAFRMLDNLSFLSRGTYTYSEQQAQSGAAKHSEYTFGVAYRPAQSNWLNLIGKIQWKAEENLLVKPVVSYNAFIISAHAYIEPLQGTEIGMKYALKNATDGTGGVTVGTLTDFVLVRMQYDILPQWNVAGEARFLRQFNANDIKAGYSVETGYRLRQEHDACCWLQSPIVQRPGSG